MKIWTALIAAGLVLVGAFLWKIEPLILFLRASSVEQTDLQSRMTLLAPHLRVQTPDEGKGPFPVVMQFHGCAGITPAFHRQWADLANEAGYAAVIVDSNSPRNFEKAHARETVCKGKVLLGQERAGDVAAALRLIETDSRLDTENIVLAGWSHGGWTIMDFLTMDMDRRKPVGFNPLGFEPPSLKGVALFYPYCGLGAWTRRFDWVDAPQVLAFIAGADDVVDGPQCRQLLSRKQKAGAEVDIVYYENANHVFDDPFMEPEWRHLYDETAHKDASLRYLQFLKSLAGPAPLGNAKGSPE